MVLPCLPVTAAVIGLSACVALGDSTQTQAPDRKPRDLNTRHLFVPPPNLAEWKARSAELRTRILHSAGLLPMPKKTPLNPVVTGRIVAPDYIIENVAIETLPGFWLSGNLYLPKQRRGRLPAILNPHGHWAGGRLHMEEDVPKAPPPPAEPSPGRANLVAIGVNLARQGYICFAYDMAGYNDTNQVSHRFAGDLDSWSWGISLMGLQLWNSIRAVDYLLSRPDVDPRRIGCTGASGGGTQTFLLCAVDERVKVGVPVNMISATMQGGCLCENGPGLRLGTDNAEIAALMAPRPLLLISCTGDWTSKNPTEEWPAIQKVYALYGAPDRTACVQFNYGHNYNVESRESMYSWFARWLKGQRSREPMRERPFEADTRVMRVWTAERPLPSGALTESEVRAAMRAEAEHALERDWPTSDAEWQAYASAYRPALRAALGLPVALASNKAASKGRQRGILVIADSQSSELAARTAADIGSAETKVLLCDAPMMSSSELWKDFFSGYNLTPLAQQVHRIAEALSGGNGDPPPKAVVALNTAGAATLFAAAATGFSGDLAVQLELPEDPASAFAGPLYAPGIRRVGDLRTALILRARDRTLLLGSPTWLPTDRAAETARELGGRLERARAQAPSTVLRGFLRK